MFTKTKKGRKMIVKCFGSSSKGNSYLLEGRSESLMIEAGVPLSMLRKSCGDYTKIAGCLVSHRHGDHSKYMDDVMKSGVRVYAPKDVVSAYKGIHWYGEQVEDQEPFDVGGFRIVPMLVNHDVQCYAYLIYHEEMGKLLFATDTNGIDYEFDDLRHIMIECNWSEPLLQLAIEEGRTNWLVAKRTRDTHMSLDKCVEFLNAEAGMANEVILLHLSHENSDANTFLKEVEKCPQKASFVAENGFSTKLSSAYGDNSDK